MSVTVFSIESAPVGAGRFVADATRRTSDTFRDCAAEARKQARWDEAEDWTGVAADAAAHRVDASINRWDVLGASAGSVGLVTDAHVSVLEAARAVVSAALATARSCFMRVDPSGQVSPGAAGAVPVVGVAAQGLARALSAVLTAAVAAVRSLDSLSAGAVDAMSSVTEALPEPTRSSANELAEAQASKNPAHTALPGSMEPVQPMDSETAEPVLPVRTTRLDTENGPVFITGDIHTADSITTFVSGVGSSSEVSFHTTSQWAKNEVAQAQAQGRSIAVIAWHGYRAPENLVAATSRAPASAAAEDLQDFQNHLRAENPRAELNVTGFSYGSVVVGTAAESGGPGLAADGVTFVGSPGVGAENAAELKLNSNGPTEVRSEHVPGDLIQLSTEPWAGVHGPDPSAPDFGTAPSLSEATATDPPPGAAAEDSAGDVDSWAAYYWQRLIDLYVLGRGDTDTHSSYLWDPAVALVR